MKGSKSKIFFCTLLSLLLNYSISFSQIKDCYITYFDSNHVMKSYSHVSLNSFNSDTLLFSESKTTHRLHIKSLIELEHTASRSHLGFVIGAAIGFSIGVTTAAIFSGRGFTGHGPKISTASAVDGGAILGVIGGIIGGAIQGSPAENFKIRFMDLSLNQKRKEVKNIFKQYGSK